MIFLRINSPNFVQFKQYLGKSGPIGFGGLSPPSPPGNYAYARIYSARPAAEITTHVG